MSRITIPRTIESDNNKNIMSSGNQSMAPIKEQGLARVYQHAALSERLWQSSTSTKRRTITTKSTRNSLTLTNSSRGNIKKLSSSKSLYKRGSTFTLLDESKRRRPQWSKLSSTSTLEPFGKQKIVTSKTFGMSWSALPMDTKEFVKVQPLKRQNQNAELSECEASPAEKVANILARSFVDAIRRKKDAIGMAAAKWALNAFLKKSHAKFGKLGARVGAELNTCTLLDIVCCSNRVPKHARDLLHAEMGGQSVEEILRCFRATGCGTETLIKFLANEESLVLVQEAICVYRQSSARRGGSLTKLRTGLSPEPRAARGVLY